MLAKWRKNSRSSTAASSPSSDSPYHCCKLNVGQRRVGQPVRSASADAGDDRLQRRPAERRVQPVEPLALLASPPHDAVRQPELPEVTPRHRRTPALFLESSQKLGGRTEVSAG